MVRERKKRWPAPSRPRPGGWPRIPVRPHKEGHASAGEQRERRKKRNDSVTVASSPFQIQQITFKFMQKLEKLPK
jgi:hypothetical protein